MISILSILLASPLSLAEPKNLPAPKSLPAPDPCPKAADICRSSMQMKLASLTPIVQEVQNSAVKSCPAIHFVASSLGEKGITVAETMIWDDKLKAYIIKGPVLEWMFNDPGSAKSPSTDPDVQFKIAVGVAEKPVVQRNDCEGMYQESATCNVSGQLIYQQTYHHCVYGITKRTRIVTFSTENGKLNLTVESADTASYYTVKPLPFAEGTILNKIVAQ